MLYTRILLLILHQMEGLLVSDRNPCITHLFETTVHTCYITDTIKTHLTGSVSNKVHNVFKLVSRFVEPSPNKPVRRVFSEPATTKNSESLSRSSVINKFCTFSRFPEGLTSAFFTVETAEEAESITLVVREPSVFISFFHCVTLYIIKINAIFIYEICLG